MAMFSGFGAHRAANQNEEAARTGGFEVRVCGKSVRQDGHQLVLMLNRMRTA